jgi:hypothetical protein
MELKAKNMESQNLNPNNANFLKYMSNPRTFTLKKWFSGILGERFNPHEVIIERVATSIVTESDLEAFGKLMGDLFEVGYMKAVNDYRNELEKIGIKISVGTNSSDDQSVKSGLA